MFDKLAAIERQYEELIERLGSPELQNDPTEYRKQSKALAEIAQTVDCFREYKTVVRDVAETQEIIASGDPDMRELAHEELKSLVVRRDALIAELKVLLVPKDPNDEKNVMLEIRAGTGGDEAALFAAELFRMYSKYAERQGWRIDVMSSSDTGIGGLKEVIATIEGRGAYSRLKYESGVHRVQRVPATEASGRLHTSTATVAVLPEAEEVDVQINEKDLRIDTFCSSGPGGQSVNTTYSAVRLTHIPTGVVVSQQDEKSQIKNRAKAMKVLRARLYKMELRKQQDAIAKDRRSQVGTGERSEKIRTYHFKENRVTDHRVNFTLHRLSEVLNGDLVEILDNVITYYQSEKLKDANGRLLTATLYELVASARRRLGQAGIAPDEASLDARLLAQHVLGWDSTRFLTQGNQPASLGFSTVFEALVARRSTREPLAYITGTKEFWGLAFEVSPDVLIPRPETELLVETTLDMFPARDTTLAIADVCTGSGCVAIAIAFERLHAEIVALDISEPALAVAGRNAARHAVADRVRCLHSDLLSAVRGPFNLIVSNPPYVSKSDREQLSAEVREFEPSIALFADRDGLAVIDRLVHDSIDRLKPGGHLMFEFGAGQDQAVPELISSTRELTMVAVKQDLQGIPRAAVARRTEHLPRERETR